MARPRIHDARAPVLCRVLWRNLWTSKGKLFKGAEVLLPPDEAALLDADDKVKIIKGVPNDA